MAITQKRFSKEVPFECEGKKRYKEPMLGLISKNIIGIWEGRKRGSDLEVRI
jgi:hypothetical protein